MREMQVSWAFRVRGLGISSRHSGSKGRRKGGGGSFVADEKGGWLLDVVLKQKH